jgi:hypothetical protein
VTWDGIKEGRSKTTYGSAAPLHKLHVLGVVGKSCLVLRKLGLKLGLERLEVFKGLGGADAGRLRLRVVPSHDKAREVVDLRLRTDRRVSAAL